MEIDIGTETLQGVQSTLDDPVARAALSAVLTPSLPPVSSSQALALYLYSESRGQLLPVAGQGLCVESLTPLSVAGDGVAAHSYRRQRTLVLGNEEVTPESVVGRDPEDQASFSRACSSPAWPVAVAALPVMIGDLCVGTAVLLSHRDAMKWLENIIWLPQYLGVQVRLAMEVVRLRDALSKEREQLRHAREQLLQSDKMASIGQLAAGVAHEINNPIGFIHSNLNTLSEYVSDLTAFISKQEEVEGLLKQQLNGNAAEAFVEIDDLKDQLELEFLLGDVRNIVSECQEGTERVKKIISDLKSFSRPDREEPEVARIDDILESALNIVWNQLKYKAAVTKAYSDLPVIECYPNQLGQVFVNLLVNAGQAIKDKGDIALRTYQEGGRVCVEVGDRGCGIPPENLARIFEPFFTTKPVGQGTGLGLSISYGIIQKHGGELNVESQVGVGTTFTVSLPLTCPERQKQNSGSLS